MLDRLTARPTAVTAAVIALVVVVFAWKTLLITSLILAIPFGTWWLFDRERWRDITHPTEQERWRMWDRMMLSGHHPPSTIDPEQEARIAELHGLDESAKFWRDQPRIDRDDPQAWKQRLDYAQRWTLEQRRAGRTGF